MFFILQEYDRGDLHLAGSFSLRTMLNETGGGLVAPEEGEENVYSGVSCVGNLDGYLAGSSLLGECCAAVGSSNSRQSSEERRGI